MAWIFKPDGTIEKREGWPSLGDQFGIPTGSWAFNPNPGWKIPWAYAKYIGGGSWIWKFPDKEEEIPKYLLAWVLLLE